MGGKQGAKAWGTLKTWNGGLDDPNFFLLRRSSNP